MTAVFIKLLNMSITASWLILAVILLRIILKKAPKWIRCILWGLVAFRLICPISMESIFSLLPSAETIPQDIMYAQKPMLHTGVRAINSVVNPYISERMAPEVGNSVNPMQVVMSLGTIIWIVGMIGMFVYALISYMRIKRKADVSLSVKENIYLCDYIDTPFVLGVFCPRIYLPSSLAEDDKAEFVIAHEKAHIRRRDHWWKPFGFLLLTVYWFNPLIWVAYILLCRDIELACDEHVIGSLKEGEKKTYSEALLTCSMRASGFHRNMISACPLAFGEVGVKERVKTVLHYKRPAFWLVVLAVLACIVAAICFLTNPKESTDYTATSKAYQPEEFLGMTYGDFQQITGAEAEFYHANFYTAIIPNTEITAVFLAEGWDDENAMTMLREEDKVIRLEGKVGDFLDNFSTKMSLEEFVKDSRWSNKLLDYTIEEGAGTAYYVANQYVEIYCDMNGDSMAEQMLQVALNQAGEIAPDAVCWMMSVSSENEQMIYDQEYSLNQAINEAILNHYMPEKPDGLYHCADFILLEQEEICGVAPVNSGKDNIELITVYGMALHESLGFSGATFHEVEYDYVPVKLKFQKESESEYILKDSWFPENPYESWDIYQEAIWDAFSPYSEELASDVIYAIQDDIYLTSLRQNCYEQAVSYGTVDTDTVIEGLLEEVIASPGTFASGVKDYIVVNGTAYKELIHYGKYTLLYCFGEFTEGGQTDLRGHIMASVCRDIALGWRDAQVIDSIYPKTTGQEWFDAFRSNAEELQKQYNEEEMNELYHASWFLLQIIQLQNLSK